MADEPWRTRAREGVKSLVPAELSPEAPADIQALVARGPALLQKCVTRLEEIIDEPSFKAQDRMSKVLACKALIDIGLKLCPIAPQAEVPTGSSFTIHVSPTPQAAERLVEEAVELAEPGGTQA